MLPRGVCVVVLGLASPLAVLAQQGPEKPILVIDAGGHTARVNRVLFTPDGREMITASHDKTVRVWDASTGEPLRVLRPPLGEGRQGELHAAALSPDGKTLAVGGFGWTDVDNPIYLISLADGRMQGVLKGSQGRIQALAFSPDGRRLVSGGRDGLARLWDVATGACERTLKGHTGPLPDLALSPDGLRLATVSLDGTGRIWSLATGQTQRVLRGHSKEVRCVAWSRDGQTIATGSDDQKICLWDADGTLRQRFENKGEFLTSLTFSPDGRELLYTLGGSQTGRYGSFLLTLASGKIRTWLWHDNTVYRGTLSADGSLAATTGGNDHQTYIWRTRDPAVLARMLGRSKSPWAAAWGPDGVTVAWGNVRKDVGKDKDWGIIEPIHALERTFSLTELEFGPAPDATFRRARMARGGLSLKISGWKTVAVRRDAEPVATLEMPGPYDMVRCFTWLPGDRAAAGSSFGLYLFHTGTGRLLQEFRGHYGEVWAVATSPDGRYLLSAAWDQTLRVWDPNATQTNEFVGVGITLEQQDDALVVTQVVPHGPAAADGRIHSGDRITGVAEKGKDMVALKTVAQSRQLIPGPAGTAVRLRLLPAGKAEPVIYELRRGHVSVEVPRVEPLLSLFFAGDEWIAWTPEGYYAASPGGERLMGWHVNNGKEQLASFYPAAQFRKSLYRPDVIKLLLRTGSVAKALEVADQKLGKAGARTEISKVLPPRVTITSPANTGLRTAATQVTVLAVAASVGVHPVTSLRLLLDGRPYQGEAGVQPIVNARPGEVRGSWSVRLTPGKHRLQVQADSLVSRGLSEEVEVTCVEAASAVELPDLYVLAVGVSDYHADLKLHYAAKDASAVAQVLQEHSKSLFRRVEVKTLTDQQATKTEILKGFGWLRKQVTQRDVAVLFFAGHGQRDSDGHLYLLPVDVDTDNLLATAVADDDLKRALAGMPGRVITLLDACHAGAAGGDKRRAIMPLTDDLVRDLVTDDYGVIVMCSSMAREFSLESNEHRHGYFTLAITEGLTGKAETSADGAVYLHQLDAYVTDRVKELSQGRQHPVSARPTTIRSFPLSRPQFSAPGH